MRDKNVIKNLRRIFPGVCLSYSARCFTSVLTWDKSLGIMVNLTYVADKAAQEILFCCDVFLFIGKMA